MEVVIGVDPHKGTNAAAVLNDREELLEYAVFATNRAGLRSLTRWAKRFSERRWAVEGASGLGRPVAGLGAPTCLIRSGARGLQPRGSEGTGRSLALPPAAL